MGDLIKRKVKEVYETTYKASGSLKKLQKGSKLFSEQALFNPSGYMTNLVIYNEKDSISQKATYFYLNQKTITEAHSYSPIGLESKKNTHTVTA